MGAEENVKVVQGIYEAFGRGDVEHILDQLADDVDWAVEVNGPAPWNGPRKGKSEVAAFFKAIVDNSEVTEFTPLAFTSSETDVMEVIRYGARVLATGKSASMDLHHWWHFRGDKVAFVRGTEDTLLVSQIFTRD